MNNKEFVQKITNVQKNFKTTYMWGTFGSLVSETIINQKKNQYPDWYTNAKVVQLRKLVGKNVWAFDCVGLIKAILWGWNASKSKSYGGATYAGNGVSDMSADQMILKCSDISTNFNSIIPGEVVWKKGHIGVYVGDGLVVECTTSWNSCVQISSLKTRAGYNKRTWTKHGKLPWVDYIEEEEEDVEIKPITVIVDGKKVTMQSVNVDGNNFVKLRDIAPAVNYNIAAQGATPVLNKK